MKSTKFFSTKQQIKKALENEIKDTIVEISETISKSTDRIDHIDTAFKTTEKNIEGVFRVCKFKIKNDFPEGKPYTFMAMKTD